MEIEKLRCHKKVNLLDLKEIMETTMRKTDSKYVYDLKLEKNAPKKPKTEIKVEKK